MGMRGGLPGSTVWQAFVERRVSTDSGAIPDMPLPADWLLATLQVRRLCSERDGLRDALERRHTEMLQLQGQVALLQSHATEAESWLMTP